MWSAIRNTLRFLLRERLLAAAGFLSLVLTIGVAAASKATHIEPALALKRE